MAQPSIAESTPNPVDERRFSLFAGDHLWGLFARLKMGTPIRPNLLRAAPAMMVGLYGGLAFVIFIEDAATHGQALQAFLGDWAAMTQFLVGLPILLAAEVHLDWRMRSAQRYLKHSGIVQPRALLQLRDISHKVSTLQHSWPDWLTWPLGIAISAVWLQTEVSRGAEAWYTTQIGGQTSASWAGIYAVIVPIGLLNAVWFRWGWKMIVWCLFLLRLSNLGLKLWPDHPDSMGGLGIISWVQMGFAFALFGVATIMAATIGYNISVKHMDPGVFAVWMPLVAFMLFAPLLFVTPLLFFTRPLLKAKQRGLIELGSLGVKYCHLFERHAQRLEHDRPGFVDLGFTIGGMSALESSYKHVEHMRIVPFDLKSLSQLVLSSASPFLPLVVKYMPFMSMLSGLSGTSGGGVH